MPTFAIRTAVLFLAALLLTSCASTMSQQADEEGSSTSFELHGSKAEAQISQARQLRVDGKYDEAADLLLGVYRSPSTESKYREEALLELSNVHSYLLNPDRDYDVALGYLETLLEEFPETELRKEAEQQIEHVNELKANAARQ